MTMPAAYWSKEREAKAIVRQIHAPRRTPNGRKEA